MLALISGPSRSFRGYVFRVCAAKGHLSCVVKSPGKAYSKSLLRFSSAPSFGSSAVGARSMGAPMSHYADQYKIYRPGSWYMATHRSSNGQPCEHREAHCRNWVPHLELDCASRTYGTREPVGRDSGKQGNSHPMPRMAA